MLERRKQRLAAVLEHINMEIDKLKETKEEEKKGKTWLNEALRVKFLSVRRWLCVLSLGSLFQGHCCCCTEIR